MAVALSFAGCTSAPLTKTPEVSQVNAVPQSLPASTALRLDTKLSIQFDWWKLLQSLQLNALIEQGFNANPTVEGAQNVLLKLQQSDLARAGYFHSVISVNDTANGQARLQFVQDIPNAGDSKFIGDAYYEIHAWQLAVGYVPELLQVHPQTPVGKTEGEVSHLQLEATYRTLAGNLMACALQSASLRAQMVAARKIVAIDQSLLSIARKQLQAGRGAEIEVAAREKSLEFSAQALLRLKGEFDQVNALLHLLLGIPDDKDLPESIDLASLHLRAEPPLELSASLIEQRPDVRAAQLEMLPANTKYESTANVALKNLENTLLTIHNDGITLRAAIVAEQANSAVLEAARKQYSIHKLNYQDVLSAEQGVQFAVLRETQARTKQLGNAIVLYHALGGGWWAMDDAVRLEIDSDLSQKMLNR